MATTKGYTAIKKFKRNGRWVQEGDPVRLSIKEALYLSLAGKVKPKAQGPGRKAQGKGKTEKKSNKKTKKKNASATTTADKEIPSAAQVEGQESPTDASTSPEGAEE
jgi:hypothetical protein